MSEDSKKRGVRVFENPVLDWASRAHPAVPAVLWIPIMAASWWIGTQRGAAWWASILLTVAGFLLWTFFEYVLHRWIFHHIPEDPVKRQSYYLVHQIHHDYHEWDRLVAPPMMSITLGVIFWVVFRLCFGAVLMWPVYAGFIIGYLAYDYTHFYTHFGTPKSKYTKLLRRRHMQHHTTYPDKWYGVSSPLWDYVFGTVVKPGDRPVKQEEVDWNPRILPD